MKAGSETRPVKLAFCIWSFLKASLDGAKSVTLLSIPNCWAAPGMRETVSKGLRQLLLLVLNFVFRMLLTTQCA